MPGGWLNRDASSVRLSGSHSDMVRVQTSVSRPTTPDATSALS